MANEYRLKFTLSDGNTIDAGKIVVPEGAKGDKGDKGDPYTLTSTDKAAIVQDVLAALPYYDGSVTISGGVELISFTIDGDHYEAEDGMTWEQWVATDYNTDGYEDFAVSAGVTIGLFDSPMSSRAVAYNNIVVSITDVIVAEREYQLKTVTTGGGA